VAGSDPGGVSASADNKALECGQRGWLHEIVAKIDQLVTGSRRDYLRASGSPRRNQPRGQIAATAT
jgi:hypothetical protein